MSVIDKKNSEEYVAVLNSSKSIGLYVVKSLIALNSGAMVALLAFLGTLGNDSYFNVDVAAIKLAAKQLLAGIAAGYLLAALTYYNSKKSLMRGNTENSQDNWTIFVYYLFAAIPLLLFATALLSFIGGLKIS